MTHLQSRAQHAEIFSTRALVAGRIRVVATPELAQQILHAAPGSYLAGTANQRILPLLPENTLLTLDGAQHHARRKQVAVPLGQRRLAEHAEQISLLVSRELDSWPVGERFAALPRLRALTLRIATTVILGVCEDDRLGLFEQGMKAALRPYALLAGHRSMARLGPASPQAAARRGRRAFAACLRKVMAGRQLPFSSDEVFGLLLAAQDTTATAIAWGLLELAHNPTLTESMVGPSGAVAPQWIDAVVHETLRLRPPLVDIVREPTGPVMLAGEPVPEGALVMICPALIGRSSVHRNPDRFDPTRFLGRRPDPQGWIPFGGGQRRCVGASLAMHELREVLSQAVGRFALTPARQRPEHERLYGTAVIPSRGGMIILSRRP